MGLSKLLVKYIQGRWDRKQIGPNVTDWLGRSLARVNVINGDNMLVCLHAAETLSSTETDLDLTGATSLRSIIRASEDPDSVLYGLQTSYNQGDYAAGEDLTLGKVTWKVSIGAIAYTITAVNQGTKTFGIAGDWTAQFEDGDTFIISGSTGNDGTFTINGTPTYASGTDTTSIIVDEAISDATVDGTINHSALQHTTFNATTGILDGYIECSWINAGGDPQTLLPAFYCRLHQELDDNQTGIGSGSPVTYLTVSEIASAYVAETQYLVDEDIAAPKTIAEVQGMARYRVTGTTAITLPTPSGDSKFWPHIINMGAGAVTVVGAIKTQASPSGVAGPHSLTSKYEMMNPFWDGTAWCMPDRITP